MNSYSYDEKEDFSGKKVKVLGPTFEKGKPDQKGDWREKLVSRDERLGFIRTAMRYWYNSDWYGSEKRKQEA
ncbi:MAG: hypothetical protein PHT96_11885 [Syntrophorhabdaceae bacterium]|nr:hypothetical protein [Syntrophorhabdaceae bacterium]MDD4197085.1 hypothetical protein [Syntrophorhabdaceae bacterium]